MKENDKLILKKLISKYSNTDKLMLNQYPLVSKPFRAEDIVSGCEVLLSGRITMSSITEKFEKEFAKYLGVKYALMVNSGSSANLLAFFALINPVNKKKIKYEDECIIPALCWSTSLWPIIQSGLKPKFVDIDPVTLNLDLNEVKKAITKKTKVILAVHVLGNSTNMSELNKIVKKNNLTLIEDTCESLGSKYNKKYLGTFGTYGTYSFYISHQITSGEGGMIVCNSYEDYNLIYKLRAHGWDRGINKKNNRSFNFVNSGFNLRPLDLTAAIGYSQFKRFNTMKKNRSINRSRIINSIKNSNLWKNQFSFLEPIKNLEPSWFGLPIILNGKYKNNKGLYLKKLNKNGVETRPIISGNFLNQPSIKLYNLNQNKKKFKNAQNVEEKGFFIGLDEEIISYQKIQYLTKTLLKFL
jgi:CDP-6-deoxy-D-xylo-4-hexulose-3-dehydrase